MQKEFKLSRGLLTAIVMLILIPVTLLLAWNYFDRSYYVTSLLVILYCMLPFFVMFEKRAPQARELVTIAVMCALVVASRAAFIWLDHFKPMAGLIIITGIALGAEAGFLIGALSMLVSNMIFGQGPWTPWQMFAFGLVGFLAGLFYRLRIIDKSRKKLCIFGGLTVFCIVGPLLDTSTFFMGVGAMNLESAIATYTTGLPVNAVHALATVLTLYFCSRPLFEKLDRIKSKYGMMEG